MLLAGLKDRPLSKRLENFSTKSAQLWVQERRQPESVDVGDIDIYNHRQGHNLDESIGAHSKSHTKPS